MIENTESYQKQVVDNSVKQDHIDYTPLKKQVNSYYDIQ